MIRKIRQRHRIIWIVLAIILPVLFIAGIVYRPAEPVNQAVPKRMETNKS